MRQRSTGLHAGRLLFPFFGAWSIVALLACGPVSEQADASGSGPGAGDGSGSYTPIDDGPGSDAGTSLPTPDVAEPDAGPGNPMDGLELESPTSVFDPKGVHTLSVTVDPGDWTAFLDGAANVEKSWITGSVTLDGTTYTNVGLRQFGDGSQQLNPAKANIRVKFNQYVAKQYGPEKLRNLRFKASGSDETFIRELMVSDLIRSLGAAAPRWSWARVTVNGEPYGLYQVLEQIDGEMFKTFYGNDKGVNYDPVKHCMGLNCPEEGCDELVGYYEADSGDLSEILALAKAVDKGDDAALIAALEANTDVDDLMAVYAVELVGSDYDGLAVAGFNFEVYGDETTGKLHFIRHGSDAAFKIATNLFSPWDGGPNHWCGGHRDKLLERITEISALRTRLEDKMKELHCGAFTRAKMLDFVDEYQARLGSDIFYDPKGIQPQVEIEEHFDIVRSYIVKRSFELEDLFGECP